MPLFEYRCRPCEHQFEALIRNGESAVCPKCGRPQVEKLISAAAGRVAGASSLPVVSGGCPPSDAPPCSPHCCRL